MAKSKKLIFLIIAVALIILLVIFFIPKAEKKYIYKIEYSEYVEKYAEEYDLDKYLIYAVMKTESNFDKNATSDVGARGLMQIMPDAFEWVKFRLSDKRELTFDDMYSPEYNIEYCAFLLDYLVEKYEDTGVAVAAYHGGMTTVDRWLADENVSQDGKTIEKFPSKATGHYVDKVLNAYDSYKNLYDNK